MPQTVNEWLLTILLLVGSAAGVFLVLLLRAALQVVNDAQGHLHALRQDVDATLDRVNQVTTTAEQLIKTEVEPTLQALRAMADTTVAARQLAHRADSLVDTAKLASVGGSVASFLLQKSGHLAVSLVSSLASSVVSLFGRKRKSLPAPETEPTPISGSATARADGQAVPVKKSGSRRAGPRG
jgi:ABC-type transporter Mla subunit MlaD